MLVSLFKLTLRPYLLRAVQHFRKNLWVVHCQIGQCLAVQGYALLAEAVHEPGIGGAVLTGTCIDTGNPQPAVSPFLQLPPDIGEGHCTVNRVFGYGPDVFAGAEKTFGLFEYFFAPSSGGNRIYGTWHFIVFLVQHRDRKAVYGNQIFTVLISCTLVKKWLGQLRFG